MDHCLSAGHANGWPPPAANVGPTAMPPVGQRCPYRVLLSGMQFCCLDYFYLKNSEDRLSSCPFIFVSTHVLLPAVTLHTLDAKKPQIIFACLCVISWISWNMRHVCQQAHVI